MFARFSPTLQGRSRTFVDPSRVLDLSKSSRTASQSTSILDLKYRKIKKTAGGYWVLKHPNQNFPTRNTKRNILREISACKLFFFFPATLDSLYASPSFSNMSLAKCSVSFFACYQSFQSPLLHNGTVTSVWALLGLADRSLVNRRSAEAFWRLFPSLVGFLDSLFSDHWVLSIHILLTNPIAQRK